jgi:hypothetical protein
MTTPEGKSPPTAMPAKVAAFMMYEPANPSPWRPETTSHWLGKHHEKIELFYVLDAFCVCRIHLSCLNCKLGCQGRDVAVVGTAASS